VNDLYVDAALKLINKLGSLREQQINAQKEEKKKEALANYEKIFA
jgi:outer membrane lipopolysaccharide assembly protein LptE/RlpB